ncbi:unnamed protein product [Cylicocyclus nassatus]|uniref:Uncharacterized protein n=1 Tax=Cylicocyclus nassatus TaxID=53992 RepID=A0AA36H7H6_CYLNA|nr:unnamed protein product [Cylicocyclus nassatus]
MLAAKVEKLTRLLEVCGQGEQPQNLLPITLRSCTKEWNLDAPSPFAKVCFNDLVLGYDFQGSEGETLTQKFICLYRFLLQQVNFATDLSGCGGEVGRTVGGEDVLSHRIVQSSANCIMRVRNYRYDFEEERSIPSNRKGKRTRVSDASQGRGK